MNQKIAQHPFTAIITRHLKSLWLDPEAVKKEDAIRTEWSYRVEPGFSVAILLYEQKGEVFVWIECAIGKIDAFHDKAFYRYLLAAHYNNNFPFRLALSRTGLVAVQFRSFADGITEEQLQIRLETLVPYATDFFNATNSRFDLEPYSSAA